MQSIQEIEKELEIESSFEMSGLVRQLRCSNYLMPMFESIVNSIQSIQLGNIQNGRIEISISRRSEQGQFELDDDVNYKVEPIDSIIISDNGIGFNNRNLKSFLKAYSTEKSALGCKGIGRFSWLKAFNSVKIDSFFIENETFYRRKFDYKLPKGIVKETYSTDKINSNKNLSTTIQLLELKDNYTNASKQKIETIARKILEHCFYYISADNAPTIIVSGHDNEKKEKEAKQICINELYKELYSKNIKKEQINIKQNDFEIKHIKLFDTGDETNHKVYFCGNNRTVLNDTVKNITKLTNLEDKIQDTVNGKKFYYVSYISGKYLDENTDEERTDFKFPEKEDALNFPNIISLSEIKKGIAPNLISYISPFLDSIQKTKMETIQNTIKEELPQYKYLLQEEEAFFDDISPSINVKELKKTLRNKHFEKKAILAEEFQEIIKNKNITPEENNTPEYNQKLEKLTQSITEAGKADLAEYIIQRRMILDSFKKYLGWEPNTNKYYEEKFVHNLIYPMRVTSEETPYDNHNLWLLDDRLSFYDFVASDKPLLSLNNIDSESKKEPDLICFYENKNIFSIRKEDNFYDSITIVEFKRPERTNYTQNNDKDENPITQILNYIDDIKAAKIKTPEGRTVAIEKEGTRFYGYIICDITDKIETFAKRQLLKMPDGKGYYGYIAGYNAYIEILSFNKVLLDCEKRNEVLFKKLGLKN